MSSVHFLWCLYRQLRMSVSGSGHCPPSADLCESATDPRTESLHSSLFRAVINWTRTITCKIKNSGYPGGTGEFGIALQQAEKTKGVQTETSSQKAQPRPLGQDLVYIPKLVSIGAGRIDQACMDMYLDRYGPKTRFREPRPSIEIPPPPTVRCLERRKL
jgi:hypothetical protein